MYQPILSLAQPRQAEDASPAIAAAMKDLALYGAYVISPTVTLLREQLSLPGRDELRPLLLRVFKTALEPLEREGDWAPMAMLLRVIDRHHALVLQDALLLSYNAQQTVDPATLPDTAMVVLAGLLDAAGRPGRALAMLDDLETSRHGPRFMSMSWQARCHILHASPAIETLWQGSDGTGPRVLARRHAQARRMEEALMDLATALDQATTPTMRRGIGDDLAVLCAWLHAHGQGALLESYRPIARHLADQPALAREALSLLLRTPASPAWEPMRETWLEAARRYFHRFMPSGQVPMARPDDFLMRCRPAA